MILSLVIAIVLLLILIAVLENEVAQVVIFGLIAIGVIGGFVAFIFALAS